jgi:CheY-like chemotaxis protein/HPt (histidine-containing phosphotransfer) domain-containing protein
VHHDAPFDIAVLDYNMPGMNGLELARALHAVPRLAPMRTLLLTSVGHPGEAASAKDVGIDAFLTKPVRKHALEAALRALVREPGDPAGPGDARSAVAASDLCAPDARILVVDDNAVNQHVIVAMLRRYQCQIEVVGNGRLALDAAAHTPFDVILMDCQMPVMDGYTATAELRARETRGTRRTPIIALTAEALQGERERCLAAGMDDYLAKPVRPPQLAAALRRWLPPALVDSGAKTRPVAAGAEASASSASTPDDEPTLDERALVDLRAFDPSNPRFVPETVALYGRTTAPALAQAREALTQGDRATVHRMYHSLKTSSAMVGARRLSALCKDGELAAMAGDMERAGAVLVLATEEFGRVEEALGALTPAA